MCQPNLPEFDREYAKAKEIGIDVWQTTERLARFFVKMDKCKDPKMITLCRKQKKALMYYFTAEYRKSKERS